MLIYIGKGDTSRKQYHYVSTSNFCDGSPSDVTPFLALGGKEEKHLLGPGILIKNGKGKTSTEWFGAPSSRNLLQSWRAMKLLGKASNVTDTAPCSAWVSVQLDIHKSEQPFLGHMKKCFGSTEEFYAARDDIFQMVPDDKELSSMLKIVRDHNYRLDDLGEIQKIANKENYPASNEIVTELIQKWPLQRPILQILRDGYKRHLAL